MRFESLEIPLGGGINQTNGEAGTEPPNLHTADDVRLKQGKRYEKRLGHTALGRTSIPSSTNGNAVFDHKGTPRVLTSEGIYGYQRETDTFRARYTHEVYPVDAAVRGMAVVSRRACNPDVAYLSGTLCVVWEEGDGGGVYAAFFDESSEELLAGPIKVSTNINYAPRIVAVNGYFLVLGHNTDPRAGFPNLYMASYLLSADTYAFSSDVLIQTSVFLRDLHASPAGTHAYSFESNGTDSAVRRISPTTPSVVATASIVGSAIGSVFHVDGVGVYVIDRVNASGNIQARRYAEDLGSTTIAALNILTGAAYPAFLSVTRMSIRGTGSGANMLIGVGTARGSRSGAACTWGTYFAEVTSVLSISTTYEIPRASMLAHPARAVSTGDALVPFHNETANMGATVGGSLSADRQQYPACFLGKLGETSAGGDDLRVLARFLENPSSFATDVGGGANPDSTDLPSHMPQMVVGEDAATLWVACTQELVRAGLQNEEALSRVCLVRLRVTNCEERTVIQSGENILIGGGVVGYHDGFRGAENAAHSGPIMFQVTPSVGTTGATANTTYTVFTLVLTWVDAAGKKHRSPVSGTAYYAVTGALPTTLDIEFLPPQTAINGDNGQLYRIEVYQHGAIDSASPPGSASAIVQPRYLRDVLIPSVVAAGSAVWKVTIAAGWAGTNTSSGVQEYVQLGELSSDPTLAAADIRITKDRAFYLPPARDRVYFSKPLNDTRAAEFNDANYILLPPAGGEAVAIEVMDDKLVILKRRAIFVVNIGAGPDANGSGAAFTVPRQLPTDTGCVSKPSVVLVPSGIMFQADKMIYMLDRNLQLQPVGSAVSQLIAGKTVSAAVVDPTETEARFYLEGQSTALVFNYEHQAWFRHTGVAYESAWVGNVELLLKSDGWVFEKRGDVTVYWSASESSKATPGVIKPSIKLPWLDLSGVAGYQRVRAIMLSGTWYGGDIIVEIRYDHSSTVVDTYTFPLADFTSGEALQLQCKPKRQKCRAIQISIRGDHAAGVSSQGFALDGVQLEVGPKAGNQKRISNTYPSQTNS